MNKTGLALSVQQPWAWLLVNGIKPVENRDWPTKVRGTVGIHAGKTFDAEGYSWIRKRFPELQMPKPNEFEKGGIVGRADLVDCSTDVDSEWFTGKYGFVFECSEPLPFIPCRGMLGFFRPAVA